MAALHTWHMARAATSSTRLVAPQLVARRTLSTPSGTSISDDPTRYCRDLVFKHDYDSFLSSYFYPRHLQSAYFALRAFNIELAMIKEKSPTTAIGQMRMKFWRDAVKNTFEDKPPLHPVALGLHGATKVANLKAYHLKRMIDAREQDLLQPTHLTLESLQAYAESTSSTMLYLLLALTNQSSSSDLSHAASHLGIAHSLTTLLRAFTFHLSKGTIVIPAEITAKHGLRQEDLLRNGAEAKGIEDAVYEFACVANNELHAAREMVPEEGVPVDALPVFLTGVPVASYLSRLETANFDIFDPKLQSKDWRLPLRVWRAYSKRTF